MWNPTPTNIDIPQTSFTRSHLAGQVRREMGELPQWQQWQWWRKCNLSGLAGRGPATNQESTSSPLVLLSVVT